MRIVNPIGKRGEDLAVLYLRKKGYKVLERNFRKGYGEIDIIAIDPSTGSGKSGVLIFIEVKTRTSDQFGTPFDAITSWKLKPLIQTALYYSMLHPELPHEMRIDAIGIILRTDLTLDTIEQKENISGF